MFKNRAMQVTMVKTPKDETVSDTTVGRLHIEREDITKLLTEMRNTALMGVGAVAALKVVTAACEIAVNYAPKN
jgi:hypothetical protein